MDIFQLIWLMFFGLIIAYFITWGLAIIDILKHDFNGSNKVIWLIAVCFFSPFGLLAYQWIGKNQRLNVAVKNERPKRECPRCGLPLYIKDGQCEICGQAVYGRAV